MLSWACTPTLRVSSWVQRTSFLAFLVLNFLICEVELMIESSWGFLSGSNERKQIKGHIGPVPCVAGRAGARREGWGTGPRTGFPSVCLFSLAPTFAAAGSRIQPCCSRGGPPQPSGPPGSCFWVPPSPSGHAVMGLPSCKKHGG